MGYQLWTSTATGYRRSGTRLSELLSVLGGGVVTRAIMEPMQSAPAYKPAEEAKPLLASRGFDAVGVKDSPDDPVKGFVLAKELDTGTVGDHLRRFSEQDLVSATIHLPDLLARLEQRERVFVSTRNGVSGIITRADLNKPPVRLYLFGLISLLEMHMQFWVATEYPDDTWHGVLSERRLEKARGVFADRVIADEGVTLLDCIQFCDKKNLFAKRHELLRRLNLPPRYKTESLLKDAEDLRNNLAHSQLDLVKGTTWEKVLELIDRIQAFVLRSDEVVEELARFQSGDASQVGLWISQLDHVTRIAEGVEMMDREAELVTSVLA